VVEDNDVPELPIVTKYSERRYTGPDVAVTFLPGDEPAPVVVLTCHFCGADSSTDSMYSFVDDDDEYVMCLDTEACTARVVGVRETPGSSSFIMDALNRLTTRVATLEEWRAASAVAAEVGVSLPVHETPTADPDMRRFVMSRITEPGTTLVHGDARHIPMDDSSVDLVVTSPPYWAQRSYTDNGGQHYEGQIGDEPTYTQFVDNLIACTREWVRVLKPSGSIWVNLGDKYSNSSIINTSLPTKSLIGLPWRYALRCIDELGLLLREDVIWSKPNGMPESATDRCRRSHEQWFHFTKGPDYYSAIERIRVRDSPGSHRRGPNASFNPDRPGDSKRDWIPTNALGALPPSVWEVATAGLVVPEWLGVDHFAAFPMELPRRIIQGFAPIDVCSECGEGRRPGRKSRQEVTPVEVCACTPHTDHAGIRVGIAVRESPVLVPGAAPRSMGAPALGSWREHHVEGWVPPPSRPGVVLDPFGGTGTVALVAEMHGRHGVHVDLSQDYLRIANWRTSDPAQRASALQVPKPPVQMSGQLDLFAELQELE
jgi:DNA modification methylase